MEKTIKLLLVLISDVVEEPDIAWSEKARDILRAAGNVDRANLEEFVSWFEKVES